MRHSFHKNNTKQKPIKIATAIQKAPLKKVINFFYKELICGDGILAYIPYEKLECGHEVVQKQDFYGYTNAYRRRCIQCFEVLQKTIDK